MSRDREDELLSAVCCYVRAVRIARALARREARLVRAHADDLSQYRRLHATDPDYVPAEASDQPLGDAPKGGPSLHPRWLPVCGRIDDDLDWLIDEVLLPKTESIESQMQIAQEGRPRPKGSWTATAMQRQVVRRAEDAGWEGENLG